MENEVKKNLRHNFIFNILDGGFFGFGIGFGSFSTVLPLFVSQMTNSALLIGLIPAIHNMGWQLPQLLVASRISRLKRMKPWVMFWTIQERLPFLWFALIAYFLPQLGITAGLILTFIALIWQGLGAGMAANAWQNMIGKIIPSDARGTFFGAQSAAANLLASLGAFIAGLILSKIPNSLNFAICFAGTVVMLIISWIFVNQTREPEAVIIEDLGAPQPLLQNIQATLKKDRNFTWFLISRILYQFGMMAFAFYIVYAVGHLHMDTLTAGLMTSVLLITQVVANPILGWLSDRWSRPGTMLLGALACLLSPLLAWFAPSLGWFYGVFILTGIANTAFWTIGMTFTMEFGTDVERPTYVGMANTLIAPSAMLSPLLGGWLADFAGYPATFLGSAIFMLVAIAVLIVFVRDPKKLKASPIA